MKMSEGWAEILQRVSTIMPMCIASHVVAGLGYALGLCSQVHVLHSIHKMFTAAEKECVEEEARAGLRWIRYSTFILWCAFLLVCASPVDFSAGNIRFNFK